ncbi:ATP-binding protein [Colwellia sp. BRX8-7]|uniref:AAA family ATPase n=1 Tax=Colwellia sp. BRX8-7 TaxID=2759833 RepID=UPI0015F47F80|nr:AAA family ATPase [Colwellia sp. BRX8-7]MBA6337931.1 ATP-binding protein [Colwellia sp. BRX8-7]
MVINKVDIVKFRGFKNVSFDLGSHITLIAGRNGTQKSTLLGLLTQPFTITNALNPMKGEKPLCGGSFKSAFSEKFKLSKTFDKAGDHEWTLDVKKVNSPFTLVSMKRDQKTGAIRFWQKGSRGQGTGYLQRPVIYLSLKRLVPIGEDKSLKTNDAVTLTDKEKVIFREAYNKILISRDEIKDLNYLKSSHKDTMGITSKNYDWQSNSAGQDNIGKILLAILSFKRLKEKFGREYHGGILAIDEIDASLYPASQVKLIEQMMKYCSKFNIQLIATTHSLPLIKKVFDFSLLDKQVGQCKVAFLEKLDHSVIVNDNIDYDGIVAKLNLDLGNPKSLSKITIFTEDAEGREFAKAIIKSTYPQIEFIRKCTFSCDLLIELNRTNVPGFVFPTSIVILDGDVKRKKLKENFVLLPGTNSPERELAQFLYDLSDMDPFWTSKNQHYDKDCCFLDFSLDEILGDRNKAKLWYNSQKEMKVWGNEARALYNRWMKDNKEVVVKFLDDFEAIYFSTLRERKLIQ